MEAPFSSRADVVKAKTRTLYVMLKHTATHDTHEFFIGDRWWRIEVPTTFTKDAAERILNRHIASKGASTPDGVKITSR